MINGFVALQKSIFTFGWFFTKKEWTLLDWHFERDSMGYHPLAFTLKKSRAVATGQAGRFSLGVPSATSFEDPLKRDSFAAQRNNAD